MRLPVILICILSTLQLSYAYPSTVFTGKVIDSNGDPIIGATIQLIGTTIGTITDISGAFSLSPVNIGDRISISFIGYFTRTISVTSMNEDKIILYEDNSYSSSKNQEKIINEHIETMYRLTDNSKRLNNYIFQYDQNNKRINFILKE